MKRILIASIVTFCLIQWYWIENQNLWQQAGPQTADEAIQIAQRIETLREKTDYLTLQAREFYRSREFQEAYAVALYVLQNLDDASEKAREIMEKARSQIQIASVEMQKGLSP
ncbi:MAG: hypothetical protein JW937_00015 [Candidatus Omnitrophica bacterium]|nr:hypothetical protein [Candidatus Omnitrophota bacterium]